VKLRVLTLALLLLGAAQPIVFVPMDDRPVTLQLPVMLGQIAGRSVVTPPRELLGRYLEPGRPDAIIAWLNAAAPHAGDYVLSSDMLAYGGLVASRVPGPSYADALTRLHEIDRLRSRFPRAWIGVFGTVMRLAVQRSSRLIPRGRICSNMRICTTRCCLRRKRRPSSCAR